MAGATFYKSPSIADSVAGDLTYARPVDTIVIDSNGFAWRSIDASTASYVPLAPGLYDALVTASTVSDTAVATAFSTGSVSLAVGSLTAGRTIRYTAAGVVTTVNAADTLRIGVRLGGTIVNQTIDQVVLAADGFYLSGEITIRTASTAVPAVAGTYAAAGINAIGLWTPNAIASTTFLGRPTTSTVATLAAVTLDVTATWSAASANNIVRLDLFNVYLA